MADWRATAIACGLLLVAAYWLRQTTGCSEARLREIEDAVFSTLQASLTPLQQENAALRQMLDSGDSAAARGVVTSALPSHTKRSTATFAASLCAPDAALQGDDVFWRNHHGRMVHRRASVGNGRLSICKRPRIVETELPLVSGTLIERVPAHPNSLSGGGGGGGTFRIRVRAAERSAVLQLSSDAQANEWFQTLRAQAATPQSALVATAFDPTGFPGTSQGARQPLTTTASVSAPLLTTTAIAQTRQSTVRGGSEITISPELIAACHRRALNYGARPLSHHALALRSDQRRAFHTQCIAAAASGSARVGEGSMPTQGASAASIPTPAVSEGAYLRFDRSFAHGLGHEALVYNLGVRMATEVTVHRPIPLPYMHRPIPPPYASHYASSPSHYAWPQPDFSVPLSSWSTTVAPALSLPPSPNACAAQPHAASRAPPLIE